ncbi:hypothetical protein QAD02_011524, partial [Eretmocerus hayati]
TWVGHTFVNGTADGVFGKGLAWCQVPIGYSLSLLFGALLFAKPMRKAEYVTMLDPLQQQYGARVGSLMFVPALAGELFWCAALLKALGSSLSVVAGIDPVMSIPATALLAATYTISGGFYSVLWTDALQLLCIAVGLGLTAPYAALHPAVSFEKNLASKDWLGDIRTSDLGEWLDTMLLAIFGSIPWQGYFQRILSVKSPSLARTLSIASMFGCLALAVPMAMIGIVARATEWSPNSSDKKIWQDGGNTVLPLVLHYLTPKWVSFAGLGAILAGVMASADSSILGISSMFSRNVYKQTMRPKASERELDWVLRISVALVSFLSAAIALNVGSVYYLAYLCSDLVYVVLFPQLLSVIHWPTLVDSYGCLAGYGVAVAIRISGGEKSLGIPVLVEYPWYDSRTHTQKFPFRSAAMLSAIFAQLLVSLVTRNLLGEGYLPRCCDLLSVYAPGKANGVVQSSSGAALIDALNDASPGHLSDAPTLSSGRTDYDASSTDTVQHYDPVSSHHHSSSAMISSPVAPGQILGVKNLASFTPAHDCNHGQTSQRILSPTAPTAHGAPYIKVPTTIITNGRLEGDRAGGDRSNMELNLNLTDGSGIVKKNIKGVKLIGMDGGTLRRPSLQGTFSPTPSVEMVNIFDRRQSSGSFGPTSLSPIPGVEACKTHGTAIGGHPANEHCTIKRGIVRHHSFNDTGDRALTTLARQPAYPSMPLRNDDCRLTVPQNCPKSSNNQLTSLTPTPTSQNQQQYARRNNSYGTISRHHSSGVIIDERGLLQDNQLRPYYDDGGYGGPPRMATTLRRSDKGCRPHTRYSSYIDDKHTGLMGHMLVSPTYSMYNSALRSTNSFGADDEAVSRF